MPHRPIRIVTSDLSLAEQLRVRLDSVLDRAVTVLHSITETTPPPGVGDEGILKGLFRNLGTKQIFGNDS